MDFRVVRMPKSRAFLNPEDGLRQLVDRAPQAEAFAERVSDHARPYLTWVYGFRRRLATATVSILAVWICAHAIFGANGVEVYSHKKAEYQSLQKEMLELQQEHDQLASSVQALSSDPKTIEKVARQELHYAKPGEFILVSPTALPATPPATHSARK